ncbi:multicopper oxidase family protein [Gordonia insulae]|uniref:Spore coat protein A n=1 Tax=Gordonia insulae TaxID=2420509 RepID=A0A3G8JJK2_9ACTN|nr:multicopper oxidase domain-containing protein [Gordonia insulae]AZG44390.1 Spore coat protein A [Gordonia insulae]
MGEISRRALLVGGLALGGLAATEAAGTAAARPPSVPLPPLPGNLPPQPQPPFNSPLNFASPQLPRFVDDLVVMPSAAAGGLLVARESVHRYHRDLPVTRAWGYGPHINGPVLEAQSEVEARIGFRNELGRHVLAADVDTTMMGVGEADRVRPRMVVHLHGAPTRPDHDGHPMISWRPGATAQHRYDNRQEAATLWYHDHAMGITRLNVQAGLAGFYLVRDRFDTGRADNPLGLPAGDHELPLMIADRTFNADGTLQARQVVFLPQGGNQGGLWGDVAVVNGVAWPTHDVARGLYRLRLCNGANSRTFRLAFGNGMRFWVIGSDQGLLEHPEPITALTLVPGERADVLVDFGSLGDGEAVELCNVASNSIGNTLFMVPPLTSVMRFVARGRPMRTGAVPTRLRGRPGLPPALPKPAPPQRRRTMTLMWTANAAHSLPLPIRAMLLINNLGFMSDDVEVVRAGTVERWDIVNTLPFEHPIHIHLARFRVIGRRALNSAAYMAADPPPVDVDRRWAPPADRFVFGPTQPPEPAERGYKDTVHCPEDSVTSLLVEWPSASDLGFDPDAVIRVPAGAESVRMESAGGAHAGAGPRHQVHRGHHHTGIKGYVWHCHNLDHEDHDMMQRIRVKA